MRVGVVGAGGAGGYFAGRWCEAGIDVTLLARGQHFEAIRENGLELISPLGDVTVKPGIVNQPRAMSGVDVVMFATKTWQLPVAVDAIRPFIRPGTVVFGIQNGVDAADVLSGGLDQSAVVGGTCRIISFIDSPGVIRHVGADPTIVIGRWIDSPPLDLDALAELLTVKGKVSVAASADIRLELWKKYLFFAPLSGIGTMHDLSIGELRASPRIRETLLEAMNEVAAVATASGITLGPEDVERAMAFVDLQPEAGTSSLQRDVAAGRPTEFASLSAHIVRLGEKLNVPTPTHAGIVNNLRDRALNE